MRVNPMLLNYGDTVVVSLVDSFPNLIEEKKIIIHCEGYSVTCEYSSEHRIASIEVRNASSAFRGEENITLDWCEDIGGHENYIEFIFHPDNDWGIEHYVPTEDPNVTLGITKKGVLRCVHVTNASERLYEYKSFLENKFMTMDQM